MSRDVKGKIARGEKLDAIDIEYAHQRGIPLPKGNKVAEQPPDTQETDLDALSKAELIAVGEQRGVELKMNMSKITMLDLLGA